MKKKSKLLIIGLILIIVITVFTVITITQNYKKEKIDFDETDFNLRILINDFLQRNPYIAIMDSFEEGLISDTDIIKSALYSEDVELDYIDTEEIEKNSTFSAHEGYKKSVDNIKEYAKNVFNDENIALNFIDTYNNENGYLILNENFIYFSKQNYPEKIYVATGQKQEENILQVQVYEYTVNENKEKLENILETGEIDKRVDISNKFVLKIQKENENIKIIAKNDYKK